MVSFLIKQDTSALLEQKLEVNKNKKLVSGALAMRNGITTR